MCLCPNRWRHILFICEPVQPVCLAEGCENTKIRSKGYCSVHYQRMYLYGRTDLIKNKNNGPCKVEDCETISRRNGYCAAHSQLVRKHGKPEKLVRNKRSHPYYVMWYERKQSNSLAEEWLDFWAFVNGIGERPSKEHLLMRPGIGPYGPNNFEWKTPNRREEGETKKEWIARQWQIKKVANPSFDRDRNLKRSYGITKDDYQTMHDAQDGLCAICLEPETTLQIRHGNVRRLAVDHCHKTGKVRALLCWRCNGTIGKIEERLDILDAMRAYLIEHNQPKTEPNQ